MSNETRNTASITSKVWAFCNPLRDVGVGYGDYLEQQKGKLVSQSELAICRLSPDLEPAEKLQKRIKSEKNQEEK
jgi:hypothetical protein